MGKGYQLKSLKGQNVGPWPEFSLDLKLPVTLIVGPNNSGKSHIRYALQFLFTGRVRDFKQFQDSGTMRRQGDKMSVMLETADGAFIRSLPKKKLDWQARDESAAMEIALSPLTFVRLPQKERGNVLSQMLRPVDTARQIRSMLKLSETASESKQAIHKRIMDGVMSREFDQALVDEWEKGIVLERQLAKRQLAPLQETQRPEPSSYKVIDENMTCAKYDEVITERKAELDKLEQRSRDWVSFKSVSKNIEVSVAECKEWEKKVDPNIDTKLEKATEKFEKLQSATDKYAARAKATTAVNAIDAEIEKLKASLQPVDETAIERARMAAFRCDLLSDASATKACPICGTVLGPEQMKAKLEQAKRVVAAHRAESDKIALVMLENRQVERAITQQEGLRNQVLDIPDDVKKAAEPKGDLVEAEALVQKLTAGKFENDKFINAIRIKQDMISQMSSGLPKEVTKPASNEAELADQKKKVIVALDRELAAHANFEEDTAKFNASIVHKRELEGIVAETDRLALLLAVGGHIRAQLVKSGQDIPVNDKLVTEWGLVGFNLAESGQIGLKGLDITVASDSEKYRVAAVLGMGLAEIGSIGFCVIDGLEVLETKNRAALLRSIEVTGLNNIILIGTDTRDWTSIVRPDWLAVYQCSTQDGVARMNRV